MTDEQYQDQGEGQGGEDNAVIKAIREENRKLKKELREAPTEDDIRAKIRRENDVRDHIKSFGQPDGLYETVASKLGDTDASREAVANVLSEIGFSVDPNAEPTQANTSTQPQATQRTQQHQGLREVSGLSASVRAVAEGDGDPGASINRKLQGAKNQDEITAIMQEAGLTTEYGR